VAAANAHIPNSSQSTVLQHAHITNSTQAAKAWTTTTSMQSVCMPTHLTEHSTTALSLRGVEVEEGLKCTAPV
jgi:hypothetical protein